MRRVLVSPRLKELRTGNAELDAKINEWQREHVSQVFERLRYHAQYSPDHEITEAEIAAGVTPTDYAYPAGDIRRYGAVGDGLTDCTAAIEAAIDQYVDGGQAVYIPAGEFLVSSRITITDPVEMFGEGSDSVVTCASASTFIFFLFEHPSYTAIPGVRLRNFRIDANGSGQLDAGIIQLNNCTNFVVDGLIIHDASRASAPSGVNGIAMSSGSIGGQGPTGIIENCAIYGCSKAAINCSSETASVDIHSNLIYANTGNGSTPGVQIFGGTNCRVHHNTISNNQGPGIFVATDAYANDPTHLIIDHNTIYQNGQGTSQGEGILIDNAGAGRIIVEGNQVYQNGVNLTGGAAGIRVQNTQDVLIDGNFVYENYGPGIRVDYTSVTVDDIVIQDNVVYNNNAVDAANGAGVYVSGTIGRLVISHNKFADTQGTPTQDWAIRFDTVTATDVTIEDNTAEGHTNLEAYSLDTSTTFNRMRMRLDWRKQTTTGSNSNGPVLELPDNSAVLVKSRVVGVKSDGSDRAGYERTAVIYRDGGGATIQGSVGAPFTEESNATWNSTIIVGSNQFAPQVAGDTSTTVNWRGILEVVSI